MKAIVIMADGFEECEALITVDILRRAGAEVLMASIMDDITVESTRHIRVRADIMAEAADFDAADILILPGGRLGTENMSASELVRAKCAEFAGKKHLAAICAAPSLLAALGIMDGREATCHPDFEGHMGNARLTHESVAVDDNIITGQGLGATFEFAYEIVRTFFGEEKVQQIKDSICYKA